MAAERKLKGEIDRTLKKVQEGQEEFESLWNQVHSCDNANLREKLEDQLKKEIKKLQRLREQIKGWIANADIKDKQPLLDARKSIERDMERFKACEREMKMAGRAGMPKPQDPKERAKEDAKEWINAAVDQLQSKVEEMEFEIEELQGGMKKKQKPPARLSELEEMTGRHKDHINRLEKVLRCIDNETIVPEESGMEALRGDMEIYLADQCEDNGMDVTNVDAMYEELADRLEAVDLAVPAAQAAHAHGKLGKGKDKLDKEEAEKERERERENEKQRAAVAAAKAQLIAQGNNNIKLDEDADPGAARKQGPLAGGPNAKAAAAATVTSPTAGAAAAAAAAATTPTAAAAPATPTVAVPAQPPPPPPPAGAVRSPSDKSAAGADAAAAAAVAAQPPATPKGTAHQEPSPPASMGTPVNAAGGPAGARGPAPGFAAPGNPATAAAAAAGAQTPTIAARGPPPGMPAGAATPTGAAPAASPITLGVWADANAQTPAAAAAAKGGGNNILHKLVGTVAAAPTAGVAGAIVGRASTPPGIMATAAGAAGNAAGPRAPPPGYGPAQTTPKSAESFDGGLRGSLADGDGLGGGPAAGDAAQQAAKGLSLDGGAAALAALPPMDPPNLPAITPAYSPAAAKQILEAAFARFPPQPSDTDWRAYRPRHPTQTPASYPRQPHDVTEHPSLFRKMDPECLFFSFYFQPDSFQQFLAAHELKRQSWRFHKQHTAWFQRFTEPSITNEDYEQGAYVYFDYNIVHDDNQTGWCYRRKENFTFRYDALEDELKPLPPPPAPAGAAAAAGGAMGAGQQTPAAAQQQAQQVL